MEKGRPSFMDSPYFVDEPGNWHLKPEAPEELQKEFEAYMHDAEAENAPGTLDGVRIPYPYSKND
ncbi:hypothetical protein D0469_05000 [Peribacillus saganii]|uniref:Uncharacterized protein n=1 Tax=Peribacillus saganii TaxID=2303992 RepID=A0A372LSB3_9BACI|nr:hypothetical protein [Peribacillus saganii]RFU70807.1 hypothetical protein D0469_05000 [Peribacillus saganii]